jgi:ADP-heptose:LPS heptosyltransferase
MPANARSWPSTPAPAAREKTGLPETGSGSEIASLPAAHGSSLAHSLAVHAPLIARNLPLPTLAALLARCSAYFGHDTGISHIAAAAGTPSTLLFGPTDPSVWAPVGEHVRIVRAPAGNLGNLAPDAIPPSWMHE